MNQSEQVATSQTYKDVPESVGQQTLNADSIKQQDSKKNKIDTCIEELKSCLIKCYESDQLEFQLKALQNEAKNKEEAKTTHLKLKNLCQAIHDLYEKQISLALNSGGEFELKMLSNCIDLFSEHKIGEKLGELSKMFINYEKDLKNLRPKLAEYKNYEDEWKKFKQNQLTINQKYGSNEYLQGKEAQEKITEISSAAEGLIEFSKKRLTDLKSSIDGLNRQLSVDMPLFTNLKSHLESLESVTKAMEVLCPSKETFASQKPVMSRCPSPGESVIHGNRSMFSMTNEFKS